MLKGKRFHIIGFIFVGFLLILNLFSSLGSLEFRALDLFRDTHVGHPDIVIVAIDNKSLQDIGRWPWDRNVHANLLSRVSQYNPRLVAFDINFSEVQDNFNDNVFEQAILNSAFPVVLTAEEIYFRGSEVESQILKPIYYNDNPEDILLGHSNVSNDRDGISRKLPVFINDGEDILEPFSYKIAQELNASTPEAGSHLVDFAGSAGSFQTIPYSAILNGEIGEEFITDKILLIGATASGLRDYLLAPVEGQVMAGVEWHANVLDNILLSREVVVVSEFIKVLIGLIFWLLIILLPLSWKTNKVSIISLILAVLLPLSSYLLWQKGIALPFLGNFAGLVLIFIFRSSYKWYQAEIERRRLFKTIENRFSPQIVDAILRDPKLLKLGGEKKDVTVFFSDIRSFTTISESISPETLSELLHEYFTEMTEEVLESNGVLDKFIGDAVMAFWGAPLEQQDQANRAVSSALKMLKRLKILQKKWGAKGWPFVDIGIGIHSGEATVGNMGSEKRFDYTVMGDTVNVASRLEGLNKEYKTHLIISETTLNKLTIKIKSKLLGEVQVKGRKEPVKIFEITEA